MLKVGIIGCGRITGHHLKSIKKVHGIKITAVCDFDLQKAKDYSKKYNIKYFHNFDEMLTQLNDIDIVAIITPSGMHYEQAVAILKRYRKHLIIEKPLFLKPSHVKKVYNLAKKYRCKIFPVFQNRYNKSVTRLKRAINSGELGRIRITNVKVRWCRPERYYKMSKWRGTFSHDGGVLSNQGIHHLDLLRYLAGEIKEIFVFMKTQGAKIEVENTIVAVLNHYNGAVGTLEVTTAARPKDFEASISIVGSKGLAQIGGSAVNELQIFTPKEKDCKKFSQKIPNNYGFGHIQLYKNIVKTFSKRKKFDFPVNERDSFNTTKLLNAFYRADELNKKVNVFSIEESKRLGRKNEKISKLYRLR